MSKGNKWCDCDQHRCLPPGAKEKCWNKWCDGDQDRCLSLGNDQEQRKGAGTSGVMVMRTGVIDY